MVQCFEVDRVVLRLERTKASLRSSAMIFMEGGRFRIWRVVLVNTERGQGAKSDMFGGVLSRAPWCRQNEVLFGGCLPMKSH